MEITSVHNPKVKEWCRLHQKKHRDREGLFLIEGMHLVEEAHRAGLIELLFSLKDQPRPPFDLPLCTLSEPVMRKLTDSVSGSGIAALCRMPERTLSAPSRCILLDRIQDPGNVGTILRTLDAFDFDGLLLLEGCADPWSVKTVRSSMGAVFRRPVWCMKAEELPGLLARSGLPLYGTALREDTVDVRDVSLDRCAIVIGSEGQGIRNTVLAMCQKTIKIPMTDRCESLNAAIAAAVLLWESYR